jgi:hypothetical protein
MNLFASRSFIGRALGPIAIMSAALLAMPSSALAKGPSQAVTEGPGIEPTPLAPAGTSTIGATLATVVEASGFFAGLSGDRFLKHRPAEELGPRYVVTYTLSGPDGPSTISQNVFPYAAPRAVTYMPQGQRFWDGERTTGGWFVASGSLKNILLQVGLPKVVPSGVDSTSSPIARIAVSLILTAFAASTLWLRRSRLRPA